MQRDERLAEAGPAADAVPRRQEAAESGLLGRLDLTPERRERRAAKPPQHIRVAPLALDAAGPQLAPNEQIGALQLVQESAEVEPEVLVGLPGRERATTLGKAEDELAERVGSTFQEGLGQAAGRHHAERVPVATGVLGCDQPLLACDLHR